MNEAESAGPWLGELDALLAQAQDALAAACDEAGAQAAASGSTELAAATTRLLRAVGDIHDARERLAAERGWQG